MLKAKNYTATVRGGAARYYDERGESCHAIVDADTRREARKRFAEGWAEPELGPVRVVRLRQVRPKRKHRNPFRHIRHAPDSSGCPF